MKQQLINSALNNIRNSNVAAVSNYDLNFVLGISQSFERGSKMLGSAASGLMALQSACIDRPSFKRSLKRANINFEAIIDASVQGDLSPEAKESHSLIKSLVGEAISEGIEFPPQMKYRLPYEFREKAALSENTNMAQFYGFLREVVDMADKRMLGEGSASTNTRQGGLIDSVTVDTTPFLSYNISMPSWLMTRANIARRTYNQGVAALMETTANLPLKERTEERLKVRDLQKDLLYSIIDLSIEERKMVLAKWAGDIYSSTSYVHDSVLFIDSMEHEGRVLRGTFEDMMELLMDIGLAKRVDIAEGSDDKAFMAMMGQREWVEKFVDKKDADASEVRPEAHVWVGRDSIQLLESLKPGLIAEINGVQVFIEDGSILNLEPKKSSVTAGVYVIQEVIELRGKTGDKIETGRRLVLSGK